MIENDPHALYRFHDDGGRLLYVGITNDPGRRFAQHAEGKEWWPQVRGISVEWYEDRPSVLAAERRAVVVEQPAHNVKLRRTAPRHVAPKPVRRGKVDRDALVAFARGRLEWPCAECGKPIEDGTGYVHLPNDDLRRAEQTWEAVERNEAERLLRGSSWQPINLTPYLFHEDAAWTSHHAACDPHPGTGDYWFDVARARTPAKLLDWTLHLAGKRWQDATDWPDFVRRTLSANGVQWDA